MTLRGRKLDPSSPAVVILARRYARKLERALSLASRRDSKRSAVLAGLYRSATVEGFARPIDKRMAAISFTAPPFRGGLHQLYEWSTLDEETPQSLATSLAWSLRESLRREARRRQNLAVWNRR